MEANSPHIVLLGDSILDNDPYVHPHGLPSVAEQLDAAHAGIVTKLARDGACIIDVVQRQLDKIPDSATVLVLSAGGNDGLQAIQRLSLGRDSLWTFLAFPVEFQRRYTALVAAALTKGLPLILCTIYQAQFPGWLIDTGASLGVRLLNRIIRSVAQANGLPVLDLWYIFDQRADYANPIEPGAPGGHKLVNNLLRCLATMRGQGYRTYADAGYAFEFQAGPVTVFDNKRRVTMTVNDI